MSLADPEVVEITKRRLKTLEESYRFLCALEEFGVDNWDGYSEAYREAFPDDDEDL